MKYYTPVHGQHLHALGAWGRNFPGVRHCPMFTPVSAPGPVLGGFQNVYK